MISLCSLIFLGITLETLWVRLETRKPSLNLTINTSFKQWVWNGIRSCEDLKFYLLETPRRALIYVDRFAYLEPETGVVIEQVNYSNNYFLFILNVFLSVKDDL